MPELINSDELKSKLLFSVVVVSVVEEWLIDHYFREWKHSIWLLQLAFRSVTSSVETKRDQIRRILQLPPPQPDENSNEINRNLMTESWMEPAAKELEAAITIYLRRATEKFDLSKNVEVRKGVWMLTLIC